MAISKDESQKSWQILLDHFKKKSLQTRGDFLAKIRKSSLDHVA
jgi:hypothetical protein